MNFFGKSPTAKETQRDADRQLRKVNRELERDRAQLEREEKKLEMEIKKAAKDGNKQACGILAKQLVQLRKQKTRSVAASSKVSGISAQNKMMGANMALQGAMGTTSKAMGQMNKLMQPQKLAADMREFQQANDRLEMTDEIINDTLDDIMAGSDEEEESDALVNRVLDEIGIEVSGAMSKAPTIRGEVRASERDSDIEARMAKLRLPE